MNTATKLCIQQFLQTISVGNLLALNPCQEQLLQSVRCMHMYEVKISPYSRPNILGLSY